MTGFGFRWVGHSREFDLVDEGRRWTRGRLNGRVGDGV